MLRLPVVFILIAALAGCAPGVPASPTPMPPPSHVPLTDDDCPVPEEIDEGAFRAALCPTVTGAVNALRAQDVEALLDLAAEESVDCEEAVAADPMIVSEFPQCGAIPRPSLVGYAWCAEPVAPTCELVARDAFGASIGQLLESADAAAGDAHGPGSLTVIGFDACGSTQVLRITLITRATQAGTDPERWIIDLFMRRRPLLAEEPVSDRFLIRRVDAAPIDVWLRLSAEPMVEGRCGELILDPLVSGSEGP